jgi:HPr kinase/phosphorylase
VGERRELVHGTCVALGTRAALLRGPSGAGKSDLALRFLALTGEGGDRPLLVADDQVVLTPNGNGALVASAPSSIAGKIEVRGLGIIEVPASAEARLTLVCDLVGTKEVPRMPSHPWERTMIAGIPVTLIKLDPFEASAPVKLKLALLWAERDVPN